MWLLTLANEGPVATFGPPAHESHRCPEMPAALVAANGRPTSGFVSGGGERSAVDDVVVDALKADRERLEQLVRQALEEQPSHQVDVPAGRVGDLVPALIGKRDLGRSPIGWRWTAL